MLNVRRSHSDQTIAPPPLKRWATLSIILLLAVSTRADPLPNTAPLTTEGDIASQMIDGIDRFLLKETEKSATDRVNQWKRDFSSADAFLKSTAPHRAKLAQILGVRDARPPKIEMELIATTDHPSLVGKGEAFETHAVRWNAFADVHGEGLLLTPLGRKPVTDVVALPDADQTPEMIAGLVPGVSQYARRLAEAGCRVIVPVLIDRHAEKRLPAGRNNGPELSNREFIHRPAFVLGRTVTGYEVNKLLAVVDWFKQQNKDAKVGVIGWGDGGMISLYAAAIDPRIDAACVSGFHASRTNMWQEPLDRNIFGILGEFGNGDVFSMLWPRGLVIEYAAGPELKITGKSAAPGRLLGIDAIGPDIFLAKMNLEKSDRVERIVTVGMPQRPPQAGSEKALQQLLTFLEPHATLPNSSDIPPKDLRESFDPAPRQKRQLDELIAHTQSVLRNSASVRREFMKNLDTSSLEKYEASAKPYRESFYNDVIGRFDQPLLPPNPRTRKTWDNEKWTGYEVMLDVFPDVFAYGVLLLPKDIKAGEKRPVVVCQHGLEGRPTDTFLNDNKSYHDYAAKLAERGFITFAPQNPYIFGDRFRTLQRKANPIGKTLFSIIIPQHQQIINFLKTLPGVDEKRIAFYGLSYGGKTAMRVPAVLTDYCLSICSADFNEWVWKNAGTDHPYSYVYTGEYEIFEWNLGSTFNYAEMAALIAPRPFMVERGHFDGVSSDEMVAFEFAKVRRLYNGQLKIGDRCEIEFFAGPHTINGKGTFDFLHKHLNWEKR